MSTSILTLSFFAFSNIQVERHSPVFRNEQVILYWTLENTLGVIGLPKVLNRIFPGVYHCLNELLLFLVCKMSFEDVSLTCQTLLKADITHFCPLQCSLLFCLLFSLAAFSYNFSHELANSASFSLAFSIEARSSF